MRSSFLRELSQGFALTCEILGAAIIAASILALTLTAAGIPIPVWVFLP